MRRAALLTLALAACADEPGPYDAETVLALMRTRGDARGTAHTGSWLATIDGLECDCPTIMPEPGTGVPLDPCAVVAPSSAFPVVEADGVLRLGYQLTTAEQLELLGPIDADGQISIGEVATLSSLLLSIRTIVRADGTITDHEPPLDVTEPQAELELDMTARFLADVADAEHVDCRASFQLHAILPQQFPQ